MQTDSYAVLYCRERAFYVICTLFIADIIWRLSFLWLISYQWFAIRRIFKHDILMWFDFNVFRQLGLKQKYQDVFLSAILDWLVQHEIGLFDFHRNTSPHTCLKLKKHLLIPLHLNSSQILFKRKIFRFALCNQLLFQIPNTTKLLLSPLLIQIKNQKTKPIRCILYIILKWFIYTSVSL